MSSLAHLQKNISYYFNDQQLLTQALTHRSYCHEHSHYNEQDNEKLEFLGDAVIDLVVSSFLLAHFPHFDEGILSKIRASLVRKETLAHVARRINLGQSLRIGEGDILKPDR